MYSAYTLCLNCLQVENSEQLSVELGPLQEDTLTVQRAATELRSGAAPAAAFLKPECRGGASSFCSHGCTPMGVALPRNAGRQAGRHSAAGGGGAAVLKVSIHDSSA
jgi:hypothetical protein